MWKLALEVGRRAIDTIAGDEAKPATKSKCKAAKAGQTQAAKPVTKSGVDRLSGEALLNFLSALSIAYVPALSKRQWSHAYPTCRFNR